LPIETAVRVRDIQETEEPARGPGTPNGKSQGAHVTSAAARDALFADEDTMHRPAFLIGALVATSVLFSATAEATPKTLKVDRFDDDPTIAISQIQGATSLECQPGFYQGEAYGVILVPNEDDYPFDLLSIDLVQGDTGSSDTMNDVTIEIYNDTGIAAAPSGPPIYSLTSADVVVGEEFGQPVVENTFMRYQFDPMSADPADHPPKITSGNVRIMIRFDNLQVPIAVMGCADGCQDPCGLTDDDGITPQRTVMNVDIGQGLTWGFSETYKVANDWMLRAVIDSSAGSSGQGGGGATSTTGSGAGGATTGAGTGGADAVECNSDADCPSLDQLCRAHKCQVAPSDDEPAEEGGCGCRVGSSESSAGALAALFGLGLLARRRARTRSSKT